ncbi:hypothetical protein EYC58_00065 [Candidatus Saccharibacteria bacterium]|nr:MAG: hypothetical protein EYC58_00065 [Candidatus Saccharibacteria bacterium]
MIDSKDHQKRQKKPDTQSWLDSVAGKDIRIEHGEIHVVDESVKEKKKHWMRNRVTVFGLAGLVVLAMGWLVAGVVFAKASVGGEVVSTRQSDAALQNVVKQQADAYRLAISYPDGSKKNFSLADMGLTVDSAKTVSGIRTQQKLASNHLVWWRPVPVDLSLVTNNAKRNAFLAAQATVTIQPASDAVLSIKDGTVVITDSTAGKHNGLKDPVNTLEAAASTMQVAPLQLQVLSTRPAITATQLAPYQAKLKSILDQSVTFTIGTKQFQPTVADKAEWVEIGLNKDGKKVVVTINDGKVLAYINKIAKPYIEPPRARIEFNREDGTFSVLSKGTEGSDIVGKDKVAAQVTKDLLNGKAVNQVLQISQADFNTVSADSYSKWIEVDLTTKRMYAYEQSNTVKTFLVSAGAPATPTVTGQYKIYSKYVQQDMTGLNADGTSYFQPNVSWINYFYQDYAIHGNYWRPTSYFGNINSSHGCVGLPNIEAQWLYNWAPVGTPVIVHT